MIHITISFRVASLVPEQSCDCPGTSEVTLKDMGKSTLIQSYRPCANLIAYEVIQNGMRKMDWRQRRNMMTSSNGNILRVTGHFYGEFIGHR